MTRHSLPHRLRTGPFAAAVLLTAPVLLTAAPVAATPERSTSLVVYGNDPCPKAQGDEIVVCARRPENERYRIPKVFRNKPRTDPASTAWAARWAGVEDAMRYTRPNSCSVVGTYGQTGCTQAMIRQWWLERQAAK